MSENSSARTWVMDWERADTANGKRSVMPPGWMPVPCTVDPPLRHAASMRCSSRPWGKNQLSGVTTFFPEANSRTTTAGSAMTGA